MSNNPIRILLRCTCGAEGEKDDRYAPLGLPILVSAARKMLPEYNLDFRIEYKRVGYEAALAEFKPHLVGISSVSMYWSHAIAEGRLANDLGIPTLFGGIHVSILPQTLPKYATLACLGEGEITFPEIIKSYIHDGLMASKKAIKGIAYWDKGQMIINEQQTPIKNLDDSPAPAYDCLPDNVVGCVITSRGCPYKCIFCSTTRYWSDLRFNSVDRIINDVRYVIENKNPKILLFLDDLFISNKKRLLKLADRMEQEGLAKKIPMICSARANLIDEDIAVALKKIGISSVTLGFESGNDEILHYLKGNNISVNDNYRAIEILHKYKLKVHGFFIIGSPGETREQIEQTFALAKKTDTFDFTYLSPYPGTPLWDYVKEKGLVSDNLEDWSILNRSAFAHQEAIPVLSEKLTRDELYALYRKGRKLRFYHNAINMIGHPLLPFAISQFWNMLKSMIKYRTY